MTDVLQFPLSFTNGRADTVVQDSSADVQQRALLVLGYPLGACVDLPPFGTPDLAFQQNGADLDVLSQALTDWEPAIPAGVIRTVLEDAVDNVQVTLGVTPDA